jgi:hypothetical protein
MLRAGESKIKNSQLIIEKATLDDRNDYYCNAENKVSKLKNKVFVGKTFVRIKGEFKKNTISNLINSK